MNGYLVDTNVLSELTKPSPAAQVEAFLRQSKDRVYVSVFSIGEIRKGVASLPASNRRAVLQEWLDNEIMPWFADRMLPVTWLLPSTGERCPRSRKQREDHAQSSIPFLPRQLSSTT